MGSENSKTINHARAGGEMKNTSVVFISEKLKNEFESLKNGRFEDQQLYRHLSNAFDKLKQDPLTGIKLPEKLWPKFYIDKYKINNLRKYDLPRGWRLMYTIKRDEIIVLNIILEWLPHKEYEKRFRY
jgi:Txe/YoeB family toxin of Txe-Axe toxin-antitoxin module